MAYWAGMKCENRPLEFFQKFSLKAFDRWRASHRFSNFIMSKTRAGKTTAGDSAEQLRTVKLERLISDRVETHPDFSTQPARQCTAERRMLRSKYLAVMNKINEKRDDLERPDSMKFKTFIGEVEKLHQQVQKPREQVADAEALLDLTNTLVMCVKSQYSEGITPSDFIFCLFRNFGQSNGAITIQEDAQNSVCWKDIGLDVSHIFSKARGCCTMLGPMNTELKKRKSVVGRKRSRPTETVKPEELDDSQLEEKTDTDKNMSIIFEILKREKRVRLDCLIFNRMSFAQTVENLFALSFLVKDGRAEISVDANGSHLVSPRNAPSSNSVMSRDVAYSHFVFRFDFKDWKLMMDVVAVGKELMPRRNHSSSIAASQMETAADNSQATLPTSPIRKFSKNRGRVLLEGSVIQQSFESNDEAMIPSFKRKLY